MSKGPSKREGAMSLYIEKEYELFLEIDYEKIAERVAEAVIEEEGCPYECQVNLLLTDNENIRQLNARHREIDAPTDVLSFPMIEPEMIRDHKSLESSAASYFDPDSGELLLGDIVISLDKVSEQAKNYGHSPTREYAFLIAHSMLHLFGYDHMTGEEAAVMEDKQEKILHGLGIER